MRTIRFLPWACVVVLMGIVFPGLAAPRKSQPPLGMPIVFEPNRGQAASEVKFLARTAGYTVLLTDTEALFVFPGAQTDGFERALPLAHIEKPLPNPTIVRMRLVGAKGHGQIQGQEPLRSYTNYYFGSDPSRWRTNVPHYARVTYEDVYPGIDLAFYHRGNRLQHDFIVSPEADPSLIRVAYEGVERLEVGEAGDLVLITADGETRQTKPLVYQEVDGEKRELRGGYRLLAENRIGFNIGEYDEERPLVIDPVLWDFLIGGSGGERIFDVGVDAAGNAYFNGITGSADFTVGGAQIPQSVYGGGQFDGFVAKLAGDGSQLLWATYLGGNQTDSTARNVVDSAGNTYVIGFTQSANFPTTPGAYQTALGGPADAFVAKLDANGSLLYSTLLGGSAAEDAGEITTDPNGLACVVGVTTSADLPATPDAVQPEHQGEADGFVAVLSAAGDSLLYATYLGGASQDTALGVALGNGGDLYITGTTSSLNLPVTPDAFQSQLRGGVDVYLANLSPNRSHLEYVTYLGGLGNDIPWAGVVVDRSEVVSIAGATSSPDFPTAGSVATSYHGGDFDAFFFQFAFAPRDNGGVVSLVPAGLEPGARFQTESRPPPELSNSLVLGTSLSDEGFALDLSVNGSYYLFGDSFGVNATFPSGGGCVAGERCAGAYVLGPSVPSNQFRPIWLGSGAGLDNSGGMNFYTGNTFDGPNEQGRIRAETLDDLFFFNARTLPNLDSGRPSQMGEPVSAATGENHGTQTVLSAGGPHTLALLIHYGSLLTFNGITSALGQNWMHNFDVKLTLQDTQATVQLFPGKRVHFNLINGKWSLATFDPINFQLVPDAGGFRFLDPWFNRIYSFDAARPRQPAAAAFALRVAADGTQTRELTFDPATVAPVPIDVGQEGEQVFLELFGTGMRNFTGQATATVGGEPVGVFGPVAHSVFPGLDQANVGPLSASLAGRGEVQIIFTVDGKVANTVTVTIQ